MTVYLYILVVFLVKCLLAYQTDRSLKSFEIKDADSRVRRGLPKAIGELLQGAKLIKKEGNYRTFSKNGGFTRAEAEFSLLQASHVVNSENLKYGQLEDTTVVLIKELRGGVINVWKNKRLSDGTREIQKMDKIIYCTTCRKRAKQREK